MLSQFLAALARATKEADLLVINSSGEDFSLGRDRQEPKGSGTPFDSFKLITDVNTALSAFPVLAVPLLRGRPLGFAVGGLLRADGAVPAEDARFALAQLTLGA